MDNLQMIFGENVRKYRKLLNLTQAQLSELIDVSPSFVGYIENGKTYPSFKTIELLALALQIPPGNLFSRNESDIIAESPSAYNPTVARIVDDLNQIIQKYSDEATIIKKGTTN